MRLPSDYKDPLVRRVEIAQEALDTFAGKPFAWGSNDCARLAALVLRRAGYKPKLSQFGDYRSDLAARKALKARKMKSVVDWIDSVGVMRVAPAATLPGDLIAFPGAGGWEGLAVVLGNGRVLAFTEAAEKGAASIVAANLGLAVAAWSVPPCRKS
jgi:cell wall-associated NlpC family hydrolase